MTPQLPPSPPPQTGMVPLATQVPMQPRIMATRPKERESQRKDDFAEILIEAKKHFREASDGWEEVRAAARDDLRFYWGDQWPPEVENDRAAMRRPCLKFNLTTQFVNQICNEERQARPSIQVNPQGSGADVPTAQIIQGIVRHIESISNAEMAYDQAFEDAVIFGFGYWRLRTDYVSDDSLDQEIIIEAVDDAFKVYLDPKSRKKDRTDARYAFIVYDITRDEFEEQYPGESPLGLSEFSALGDVQDSWQSTGTVRLVEYYRVRDIEERLVRLVDGSAKRLQDLGQHDLLDLDDHGKPYVRKRTRKQITWYKMSAAKILDQKPIPGKIIPVIEVIGREKFIDGHRRRKGIIRDLMDPQRAYNYDRTSLVETNSLVPKAPWQATPEQVEGHEEMYQQGNTRNFAVMYYNAVRGAAGEPLPAPNRVSVAPAISHLVSAVTMDMSDMQAIGGLYRPSLGAEQEAGQSGAAIKSLQRQGQIANSHFQDNLKHAMVLSGRVVVDWIPVYYDAPRAQRIINPDSSHEVVQLNQIVMRDDGQPKLNEYGRPVIYDVTVGRYDVSVSVGPSFASRREEFVKSVLSLAQAAPQLIGFIADLLVRNMDWPGADEIAERLRKMLPPQLLDDNKDQPPVPPQIQAQVQQLMQQLAQTTQQLQQAQQIISTKQVEASNKLQIAELEGRFKKQIAEMQARTALMIQAQKDGAAGWETMLGHDYAATEHQLDLIDRQAERDAAKEQAEQDAKTAAAAQPSAAQPAAGPQPTSQQ